MATTPAVRIHTAHAGDAAEFYARQGEERAAREAEARERLASFEDQHGPLRSTRKARR